MITFAKQSADMARGTIARNEREIEQWKKEIEEVRAFKKLKTQKK